MSPRRRGRLPLPTSVRRGLRGGDCHCAGRRGKHQTGGRGDATQEKDGDSYGDGRGGWDASWGGSKSTVPPLPFPTPSPSRLVRCHRRGSRDFDCGRRDCSWLLGGSWVRGGYGYSAYSTWTEHNTSTLVVDRYIHMYILRLVVLLKQNNTPGTKRRYAVSHQEGTRS